MNNNFSILMFIFGVLIFFVGLYIYSGHDVSALLWKAQYRSITKMELKNIGKWTMISSAFPFLISIIVLLFDI